MSQRQRPSESGVLLPKQDLRGRVTRPRVQAVLDDLAAGRRTVPKRRRSNGHCLPYGGVHYPPKFVACMAGDIEFNEAKGLHWLIEEVGFATVECDCGGLGSDSNQRQGG